ncbi:Ig-like domain-containing protein [Microbacterium sp. cx-59]|uniref:Ig-like domain-containing protein n=1 Tax=Microbacterium sp. cx-59 TaxID=2891207 RepID=UPI001E3C103B|nr:Ig-like domain-containing protein [Microbacterium sp. cx-59]MCC4908119.1 Ig-like domain-containing protein [Microbacterium sp. cx-59]
MTAVTGALALVLGVSAAAPAPAALALTEAAGVGAPQQMLIESVHASGKVLEIGNDRAQLTGADNQPAAAAIFARGTNGPDLVAQTITAYPVTGKTATYVFANPEGEVLVRNANESAAPRFLSARTVDIAAAAQDPYAQWVAVDAGSGAVYLHNVQPDGQGRTAALDMYDWKTADTSQIQTYDSGTAAVQKWLLRSVIPEVAVFSGRTDLGAIPVLPSERTARYSWGATAALTSISWNMPAPEVWQSEGTVTVSGTGVGLLGETVPVSAQYVVGSLGDAIPATISGHVGITVKQLRMLEPARVERRVSGSSATVSAPVVWDWTGITDAAAAQPGTFTVPAAASSGFSASLVVTIVATEQVNIARGAGIHFGVLFGEGSALNDGNRDRVGFSDWRSGGAANRVTLNRATYFFDQPQQITGAAVFDRGTDAKLNVGTATVQYRNLTGGWVDLPAKNLTWPYTNATPQLELTVDSEPVLATGARVVITTKSTSTWMSLSEFEVYGPASAPSAR